MATDSILLLSSLTSHKSEIIRLKLNYFYWKVIERKVSWCNNKKLCWEDLNLWVITESLKRTKKESPIYFNSGKLSAEEVWKSFSLVPVLIGSKMAKTCLQLSSSRYSELIGAPENFNSRIENANLINQIKTWIMLSVDSDLLFPHKFNSQIFLLRGTSRRISKPQPINSARRIRLFVGAFPRQETLLNFNSIIAIIWLLNL